MLLVLFGLPGSGKSYIGNILQEQFGYYHYEADEDIMSSIKVLIRQNQPIPEPLREAYFEKVCTRIVALKAVYPNLVVTQTFTKEKDRKQILGHFPEAKFIRVQAELPLINARLTTRKNHLVSKSYAAFAIKLFEQPAISHWVLMNNGGIEEIRHQLIRILDLLDRSFYEQQTTICSTFLKLVFYGVFRRGKTWN